VVVEKMNAKERERLNHIITHAIFIFICLVIAFPIFWMVSGSFMSLADQYTIPPKLLPSAINLDGWVYDFQQFGILTFIRNSLGIAAISTCLVLLITMFSGYSLARFAFKGKVLAYNFLLLTQFVPAVANLLTLYIQFAHAGLINSWLALIILYTSGGCVLGTLLFSGFFRNLPISLEEAAMMDGTSRLGAFVRVILPIMKPAIITVIIFTFTGFYGEVQIAHLFTLNSSSETLPVIILDLETANGIANYATLYAVGTLIAVPPLILFIAFQKYFNPTLGASSWKG
jgi:multiple sugar transport system permease protein